MAVLDVLPYPNPFLRKKAEPVEEFDEAFKQIVADMYDTMAEQDGIGLAATQVGIDLRLLILSPYVFEGDAGRGKPNLVVANPEVVWQSDERVVGEEGCLSFPGVFIQVERPEKVRIRAWDADGEPYEIEGSGLGARAILHEIDHLEGVVMVDRVSHLTRKRALKKHEKHQKALARKAQEERRKARR